MTKKYLQQFIDEAEKCKDPVYLYENHILIDGKKPRPLNEYEKDFMRGKAGINNNLRKFSWRKINSK